MAEVSITHTWPGENGWTSFTVELDGTAYPDELAEAKATVLAMYRECVGITEANSDGQ